MFKIKVAAARVIPFTLLKALGMTIVLDKPSEMLVPASGKGAPAFVAWKSGWMSDLLQKIIPCSLGLFIDAGANIGQTLLAYRVAGGASYLGIEPNPICTGFIDEVIALNQLQDFKVISLALSDENGLSHLYTSYATDTGATMVTNLRSIEGRHEQIVPTYSLDSLASALALLDIGIIKIDVESFELEVIRGARKIIAEKKPVIVCEILGTAQGRPLDIKQKRNDEIYEILIQLGYRVYNLKKSGDNRKVIGMEEIKSFPHVHWSEVSKENFDYLFIPEEKIAEVSVVISE